MSNVDSGWGYSQASLFNPSLPGAADSSWGYLPASLAAPLLVEPGGTVTVSSGVSGVSYTVVAPGLAFSGTGSLRTFSAPLSLVNQTYEVTWTVTRSGGAVVTVVQFVTVLACTIRVAQMGGMLPAVLLVGISSSASIVAANVANNV